MLVGWWQIEDHLQTHLKTSRNFNCKSNRFLSNFITSDLVGTADLHQMHKAWSSGLWTTLSTVRLAVRDPEAVSSLESATFRDI